MQVQGSKSNKRYKVVFDGTYSMFTLRLKSITVIPHTTKTTIILINHHENLMKNCTTSGCRIGIDLIQRNEQV